ncbi:peptidoglycan -binding protein [Sulfitobacter sp. CW3]|uniref:peptidoglycan -binding protein n=1 Tax=Sulfitobacter sp. CW3 TaxID=2861965 RepID=UPI001C5EC6F9|nr:peptidoglycan -binding protein [Sulfitobacter sp. CW3]MBW4962007.1 peptidoglycan -binding protein [Sulfitobacter sp. CW3]
MALSRRSGSRFQSSIWPGFVDAMTGLLLVLMFVLTIFMVLQAVQTQRISGQEDELNSLSGEVAALAQALGMERQTSADLEARVGALNASLTSAQDQAAQQAALIASLTSAAQAQAAQLQDAQAQITDFEAQVASLLSQRDDAQARVTSLEGEQADLLSAQEALNLALAQARSETDAQAEAARLAAARREALDALVADLRARNADVQAQLATAEQANAAALAQAEADRLANVEALSEAEAAKLAEAAAAELLRAKLQDADAELTAMTLALEAQRKDAEDTLTLLAAARAAEAKLNAQLDASETARQDAMAQAAKQMTDAEKQAALLALAQSALAGEEEISAEAQRQTELLNQQVASLRGQLGELQALLDDAVARDAAKEVQLQSLGSDLNTALARVAAEERRRAELEAAERKRLEAETKNLEQYRSEFFGRLRDLLGNQAGVRIEGDRFVFSSEVLFPPGAATLSSDGRNEIAKVARILRNVASEIPPEIDWVIRVDGHTDNQPLSGLGEFEDNWELSQARALSVVKYMINFLGIAPDRLAANGFGQYQPVAAGDSEEARAQNRRIELKFTEK